MSKLTCLGISRLSFWLLYLVGLEHLKSLNLNSCRYVSDMTKLLPVKETLEELDISNCSEIKDLSALFKLR